MQARLLYHEAAVLVDDNQASINRLALLREALEHSKRATDLNPSSLSSAALRATLVVNVLVEESLLRESHGWNLPDSADRIKEEFRNAIASCSTAARSANPTLAEPVINIREAPDSDKQTVDPCSLRIQDSILQWVREGRWDRVVQEKRNVLVCMQQVLQSCHTLLDSSQIPVDGVVRLLQHILRSAWQLEEWCGMSCALIVVLGHGSEQNANALNFHVNSSSQLPCKQLGHVIIMQSQAECGLFVCIGAHQV